MSCRARFEESILCKLWRRTPAQCQYGVLLIRNEILQCFALGTNMNLVQHQNGDGSQGTTSTISVKNDQDTPADSGWGRQDKQAVDLWHKAMGGRIRRGTKVAMGTLARALDEGNAIVGVAFYPPSSHQPVEVIAYPANVTISIKFPDAKKFWKNYHETKVSGRPDISQDQVRENKKMVLESFDLFLASHSMRLNRSSRSAIETLKSAISEDAGAVVVMYVPKDLDELIDYQVYPFETKVKIEFPKK